MWNQALVLLEGEFSVHTPDLLGHGSREAAWDGITLADLADDVARQVEPGTHVVGFSLGALVAQHLARHRPELVASLTSVNSVCRRTNTELASVLARLAAATANFPESVAASLLRWFPTEAAGAAADPKTVAAITATLLANDVPSYLNCYRVFATADAEIGAELGRITAPSIAITGEFDPGSTPEMAQRLAAAIPNCTAVAVPHSRHMLPVERPQQFAAALTAFLRENINVR
jgi:Predicted hydrolases or acyltransferases (alpha/beta hydrolase superfamily)